MSPISSCLRNVKKLPENCQNSVRSDSHLSKNVKVIYRAGKPSLHFDLISRMTETEEIIDVQTSEENKDDEVTEDDVKNVKDDIKEETTETTRQDVIEVETKKEESGSQQPTENTESMPQNEDKEDENVTTQEPQPTQETTETSTTENESSKDNKEGEDFTGFSSEEENNAESETKEDTNTSEFKKEKLTAEEELELAFEFPNSHEEFIAQTESHSKHVRIDDRIADDENAIRQVRRLISRFLWGCYFTLSFC